MQQNATHRVKTARERLRFVARRRGRQTGLSRRFTLQQSRRCALIYSWSDVAKDVSGEQRYDRNAGDLESQERPYSLQIMRGNGTRKRLARRLSPKLIHVCDSGHPDSPFVEIRLRDTRRRI